MGLEKVKNHEYSGGCLCNETTFIAKGEPKNAHLCSCTMCQKSSGAPTVAWVEFALDTFQWDKRKPGTYQSSTKTKRCFCVKCGGLLGTLNEGYPYVCITIASLHNPNLIVPGKLHSHKEQAPCWWDVSIVD
jgi:hypothetical protein